MSEQNLIIEKNIENIRIFFYDNESCVLGSEIGRMLGYCRGGYRFVQTVKTKTAKGIDHLDIRDIDLQGLKCTVPNAKLFYNHNQELSSDVLVYLPAIRQVIDHSKINEEDSYRLIQILASKFYKERRFYPVLEHENIEEKLDRIQEEILELNTRIDALTTKFSKIQLGSTND